LAAADIVINMTGRPGKLVFTEQVANIEDWDVGDPYGFNLSVYRGIRDEIETRVEDLARRIREKAEAARAV
jgi:protein-tyrosine-phosphatase